MSLNLSGGAIEVKSISPLSHLSIMHLKCHFDGKCSVSLQVTSFRDFSIVLFDWSEFAGYCHGGSIVESRL